MPDADRDSPVSVFASCEGLSARAETKVEAVSPYQLVIVAFDSEVRTDFGVRATMEFLDGPRARDIIETTHALGDAFGSITWPVKVRFTAEDYAPKEFVLSESTGTRHNPDSTLYDFWIPMTFTPDASTDTYTRTMSQTEMEIAHPFALRVAGRVRVRTWWSVDYNDGLFVELVCGGRLLPRVEQRYGSAGDGFIYDVQNPGPCEVRLRQLKPDASTHYRVAITYPH